MKVLKYASSNLITKINLISKLLRFSSVKNKNFNSNDKLIIRSAGLLEKEFGIYNNENVNNISTNTTLIVKFYD